MLQNEGNTNKKELRPRIFISTGASGGHIFPGLAIADALRKKGYLCTFIGSGRQFTETVTKQGFDFITLPASQLNTKGIKKKIYAIYDLGKAFVRAIKLVKTHKPVAVLGMGSYASVAGVLAAKFLGVPTLIHEQNAKPGRANLLLAPLVGKVLLSFAGAKKYFRSFSGSYSKYQVVGNPVREEVLALRGIDREEDGKLYLLVFGGSQGSRIFSDVVPEALAKLPVELQKKIHLVQQARPEDIERLQKVYSDTAITPVISSFFNNLPELMKQSHLVIGRAGTGSISELAILNRASILVPLRIADGHQVENAKVMSKASAASLIEEGDLTAKILAEEVEMLLTRTSKRKLLEENAALLAKPQAAQDAAAEVIALVTGVDIDYDEDLSTNN